MYRPVPSIGSKSCLWVVGWMYQVDVYLRIRRAVMVDGISIREVSRAGDRIRPGVLTLRQAQEEPFTAVIDQILVDGPQASQEAAPHSPADLPAAQGRAWVRRPVHHSQGLRKGAPPPVAGDVRPSVSSAGPRPVRLWRGPGDHWRGLH